MTRVRLTILRHATAGHVGDYPGPDVRRPLDEAGERDAEQLVPVLMQHAVGRIVSSPATRCIQTLGPLARAVDRPIELWEGLGPDADELNLLMCFASPAFDTAVLCTHGEVMSPLLRLSAFRSLMRDAGLDQLTLRTQGTGWRLRLSAQGRLVGLNHVVPGTSVARSPSLESTQPGPPTRDTCTDTSRRPQERWSRIDLSRPPRRRPSSWWRRPPTW